MGLGGAGGDDADAIAFKLDMHHEQQSAQLIETDNGASSLRDASANTSSGSMNTLAASSKRIPRRRKVLAAFSVLHTKSVPPMRWRSP